MSFDLQQRVRNVDRSLPLRAPLQASCREIHLDFTQTVTRPVVAMLCLTWIGSLNLRADNVESLN